MNKLLMIGILFIAFVGIGLAGAGGLLGGTEPIKEDISLEIQPVLASTISTRVPIETFNDLKYELKCTQKDCTIILNKKGVFQNRELKFNIEQTCLEWTKTDKCLDLIPATISEPEICREYEYFCGKFTEYTKEDFTKMAIQKEIEFVASTTKTLTEKNPIFDSSSNGNVLVSVVK